MLQEISREKMVKAFADLLELRPDQIFDLVSVNATGDFVTVKMRFTHEQWNRSQRQGEIPPYQYAVSSVHGMFVDVTAQIPVVGKPLRDPREAR